MKKEEISKYANLLLALLFPVAWFAPLIRTGTLRDISVVSRRSRILVKTVPATYADGVVAAF